ncbi:MAG: class I SAM-dependent methyltransferase [Nanoarchaeota archaeon]|nr:class I SAM-dependent methyltransferase [Nanoarchaeota archaeon]
MKYYNKEYALNHQKNAKEYWEYKEIFRLFTPKKNSSILEIGCNTGDLIKLLYERGYKNISGIDINSQAVKIAKKKVPKANIQIKDIMKTIPEKKYDIIYALHIIEHFENTEDFLKKIKNLLNNKGILIISCPNKIAYLMRLEHFIRGKKHCFDPTHEKYFSILELQKECRKIGFKIMRKSTLPLDLITQKILEGKNIRIPATIFGGHNYIVCQND